MGMYAALVRGVNVGGRNRLPSARLADVARALGHAAVCTYLQSGNVVFAAATEAPEALGDALEERIRAETRLDVRVLVRSAEEMRTIVSANPLRARSADGQGLHVTFVAAAPEPARLERLVRSADDDMCEVRGREVFLYCPNGYGRTRLHNGYLERALGVAATTRNWRTVTALAEMCGG